MKANNLTQKPKAAEARCAQSSIGPAVWVWSLLLVGLCGCATPPSAAPARTFDFQRDTFAFANQLRWEYHYDANGKWVTNRRQPPPSYSQHCFVIARSARQFFLNARFDSQAPVADAPAYRRLIRRVVASTPRRSSPAPEKIVIPGYSDLRQFSQAQEKLLKEGCGGGWHSYFQRGHWRVVFPFSRRHQERMAKQLLTDLKQDSPLVVHLVRFPQLTINHAVIVFAANETEKEIRFLAYDPNLPAEPRTIAYNRATRTFLFPANDYFPGGRVDVYEIYCQWNY